MISEKGVKREAGWGELSQVRKIITLHRIAHTHQPIVHATMQALVCGRAGTFVGPATVPLAPPGCVVFVINFYPILVLASLA